MLLLVIFFGSLVFAFFTFFKISQFLWSVHKTKKALEGIAGWPTHWLWGNLHQLEQDQESQMKWLAFIQQNRLKLVKYWLGPFEPVIQLTHPDCVKKMKTLPKDKSAYFFLMPWLGDGLLTAGGEKWERNRRLLTPAFHYGILKGYIPAFNSCLEIFLKKWTAAARNGVSVQVFKDVSMLSLDILIRCAFSTEGNCQLSDSHPYISAIPEISELVIERGYSLFNRPDFIYYRTSAGKRFKKACKLVHDYTESLIRERKKTLELEKKKSGEHKRHQDFLDILLTVHDENGKGLSDLEIRDEADTFMFEGHDTTTSGMSWTLYCLAQHPEHQEKIREEVRNVLMGRERLDYDDLKELKYTLWCIKEGMRLYPPVFQFVRCTKQDTELEGHIIPKGTTVDFGVFEMQRHPDIWKNPNEYDPLRFHPSNAEGRHPYAYMPFSAGYRNCIGQTFALNEERMVIAYIINRFHISLDETHKVEMIPKLVIHAKNDIKLRLTPCH